MDDNAPIPEVFNDRRVTPWVHPQHSMVGDPHYIDPRTVAWVEREPGMPYEGLRGPRWRVQHLQASSTGSGSMQTSTRPMRARKDALEAFEMVKSGSGVQSAGESVLQARRDRERERRDERRFQRFKGYNQAVNPGSFG